MRAIAVEVRTFYVEVRTFYAKIKKAVAKLFGFPTTTVTTAYARGAGIRASPFPSPLPVAIPSLLLMRGASLSLPDAHGAAARASILFKAPQAVAARDVVC